MRPYTNLLKFSNFLTKNSTLIPEEEVQLSAIVVLPVLVSRHLTALMSFIMAIFTLSCS